MCIYARIQAHICGSPASDSVFSTPRQFAPSLDTKLGFGDLQDGKPVDLDLPWAMKISRVSGSRYFFLLQFSSFSLTEVKWLGTYHSCTTRMRVLQRKTKAFCLLAIEKQMNPGRILTPCFIPPKYS
jgi:hypothetical protein